MAKYLWQVSYTVDGAKGLMKEGGSGRVKAVTRLIKDRGGKIESFYFAFGDDDAYVIADLPNNVEAAAISLAVAAAGAARVKTVVLLNAEDVDAATKVKVSYRAPGA